MSFRYLITKNPSYNQSNTSSGWNYDKPSMYLYAYDESRVSKEGNKHINAAWVRLFHTYDANYDEQKKQIKNDIAGIVKNVSFSKGMSVKAANELINDVCHKFNHRINNVDTGVENIFKQQDKYGHIYEQFMLLEFFMTRAHWVSPEALKEILGVQKQNPFKKAIEFIKQNNNNRKEAMEYFPKLDARFKQIVKHFAKEHGYNISDSWIEWVNLQSNIWREIVSANPNGKNIIEPGIVISRVEHDLLRDELQYKYFKQTGNPGIFLSAQEKERLGQLSDNDLLEKFGRFGLLYHKDAYVIGERMKNIGKDIKALDVFCSNLIKISDDTMPNQDVIKMYFEIMKQYSNKFIVKDFEKYSGLQRFVKRLYAYCESKNIKQQMSDSFGKKVVANMGKYALEQEEKEAKNRIKNNLRQASERLQKGEIVSGAVIATDIADLILDYDVKQTDKTAKKVMSKKRLSNVQKNVLNRYKTRG